MSNYFSLMKYKERHYLYISFAYILFFLFFFSPVLFTTSFFPSDGLLADFHSNFELWTNNIFSGYPVFSAPRKQFAYPPRLLFSLFPTELGFNLWVVSAYVMASIFTYGYVFSLTKSSFASFASGLVFSTSAFMMSHLIHGSMIHVAAWMPLTIWSLNQLRYRYSFVWLLVGSTSIAMSLLAGHPQITIYTLILSGFYVILMTKHSPTNYLKYYLVALSVILLGIGLSSFQILSTLELSQLSARQMLTYEQFKSYTLPLSQLSQLFFPFIFGGYHESFYSDGYFGKYNFHELSGYSGIFTIMLATIGVINKKRSKEVRFWFGASIVSLIVALGDSTPIFQALYEVPIFNLFRAHGRIFVIMSFALAILVGYGINSLQKQSISKQTKYLSIKIVGTLMIFSIAVTTLYSNDGYFSTALTRLSIFVFIIPLIIFISSAAIIIKWTKYYKTRKIYIVVLCLLILDLSSMSWFTSWKYKTTSIDSILASEIHTKYKKDLEKNHNRFATLDGFWSNSLTPDQARSFNIESVNGYLPLQLKNYKTLVGASNSGDLNQDILTSKNRTLDILTVKYISSNKELIDNSGRLELIEKGGDFYIYKNANLLPRAWLVNEALAYTENETINAIKTSTLPNGKSFNPKKTALIDIENNRHFEFKNGKSDKKEQLTILKINNSKIDILTDTKSRKFLVLSDIYYPGWHAYIDNIETKIIKTNLILRGVLIPAGKHKVRFNFQPNTIIIGSIISLVSILILVLAGLKYYNILSISRKIKSKHD